jgi:ornithine carbamoyltransferase
VNGDVSAPSLRGRSFLKELDFTLAELGSLIWLATDLKAESKSGQERPRLNGKKIALVSEKPSTRTRCAFEVAAYDQGAHVTYLGPGESQIGHKESIKDTARVLGRMYDAIEYRGFGQEVVEELAASAGVPVYNGLSDEFHPTQMLADMLTMSEHSPKPLDEIAYCYLGDARFNTGNSLMVTGCKLGMDVRICAPRVCRGPRSGGVDFIYTDVWVSVGEDAGLWKERIELLLPYQVNAELIRRCRNPDVKFMHCLPALHNRETATGEHLHQEFGLDALEVTDEVFESSGSVVFDEAENRLHTIKALMVATLAER